MACVEQVVKKSIPHRQDGAPGMAKHLVRRDPRQMRGYPRVGGTVRSRAVSEQEEKSVANRMFWSEMRIGVTSEHIEHPPLRRRCHNVLPFFVASYSLVQPRFPFCHPARHPLYAQPPPLGPSFSSFPSRPTPAAQGIRPALPPGTETPEAPRLPRVCPTPVDFIARSFSKQKKSRT
jgi:hypothetical protein